MLWIYLSPHLDDAVLSCGGLIHHQTRMGDSVEVWTICAGDPPENVLSPFARSLHERWEAGREAVETRRREDRSACEIVGARAVHLSTPDCIYRRHPESGEALYASEEDIFGVLDPVEYPLIDGIAAQVRGRFPEHGGFRIVAPLGIGGHVDHDLTRRIAEGLAQPLLYYADFPYSLGNPVDILGEMSPLEAELNHADLTAWQKAIQAYPSQLSTFWETEIDMKKAIQEYHETLNGVYLWKTTPSRDHKSMTDQ